MSIIVNNGMGQTSIKHSLLPDSFTVFKGKWRVISIETCDIFGIEDTKLKKLKKMSVEFENNKLILFDNSIPIEKYYKQEVMVKDYIFANECNIDYLKLHFLSDSVWILTADPPTKNPNPAIDFYINGKNILVNIDGVFFTLEKINGTSVERNSR